MNYNEEVNNLNIEDVLLDLQLRILMEMGEDVSDPSVVDEYEFDQASLELELEEYKSELIQMEEDRLADLALKEEIISRLNAIDTRGALFEIGRNDCNLALVEAEIIKNRDLDEVKLLEDAANMFHYKIQVEKDAIAAKKLDAEVKLEALGLTREDLKILLGE